MGLENSDSNWGKQIKMNGSSSIGPEPDQSVIIVSPMAWASHSQ